MSNVNKYTIYTFLQIYDFVYLLHLYFLVSILTFITLRDNRKEEDVVKNVIKKV